jgi:hypothetical protein
MIESAKANNIHSTLLEEDCQFCKTPAMQFLAVKAMLDPEQSRQNSHLKESQNTQQKIMSMASCKAQKKIHTRHRSSSGSASASTTATLDLLHDIHVARATSCVFIKDNATLGCDSVCGWACLHASALEGARSLELLLPSSSLRRSLTTHSPVGNVNVTIH